MRLPRKAPKAALKSKLVPAETVAKAGWKDSAVRRQSKAVGAEFALASTLVAARLKAGLTQDHVARRMGTTQAVIARLESGRAKPSTRTLERFARATGTRLHISFEPQRKTRRGPAAT